MSLLDRLHLPEHPIERCADVLRAQRRRVLRAGFAGAAALAGAQGAARAATPAPAAADGIARAAFVNTHTGERVDVVYREGSLLLDDALREIDRVLRDHRSDEVHPIDRALLDTLDRLRGLLDTRQPFHVISGYRSPSTNAKLAAASSGVARNSMHLQGRAIDIRLPGRELADVRRAALSMQAGGVGYYPSSQFVHLDTGRVRTW